jgi:hypothetical protein
VIRKLRQRAPAIDDKDVGIVGEYKPRNNHNNVPLDFLKTKILTKEMWKLLEYPDYELISQTDLSGTDFDHQICDRCNEPFQVSGAALDVSKNQCRFHFGRVIGLNHERVYSCCKATIGTDGCCQGPHVFKISDDAILNTQIKFQSLQDWNSPYSILALDCEMIFRD